MLLKLANTVLILINTGTSNVKFFRYETIETHALTFLSHIILASAGVSCLCLAMYFTHFGVDKDWRFCNGFCKLIQAKLKNFQSILKCNIFTALSNYFLSLIPFMVVTGREKPGFAPRGFGLLLQS